MARVFVSYARRQPDEDAVLEIVKLCKERFLIDVWVDKRDIAPGKRFDEEIRAAIRTCDATVFVGSASSLSSEYCLAECEETRACGKLLVPLFIEDVDWTGFPATYKPVHFDVLFRAADAEEQAAMVGSALARAGLDFDHSRIPHRRQVFDCWAGAVHPKYASLRAARDGELNALIADCRKRLQLREISGYQNVNLALLLLHAGDVDLATSHLELAQKDLPGRPAIPYYLALALAAKEHVGRAPRSRLSRIIDLCETARRLGPEKTVRAGDAELAALPYYLQATVVTEAYLKNGLRSPCGDPEVLFAAGHAEACSADELQRLADVLDTCCDTARADLAGALLRRTTRVIL